MRKEVELITETGATYRALLRPGTPADRVALVKSWAPLLERESAIWLDWEWPWKTFGTSDLHLDQNPEWLVITDELESEESDELFGVLVTTGPTTAQQAGIEELLGPNARLLWVEYIAIAPAIRPNCPYSDQRKPRVKGVGRQLMCAAVARSVDLDLEGKIGLHAEGPSANTYTAWGMHSVGNAGHRAGGSFPVFFGDAMWATGFIDRTE